MIVPDLSQYGLDESDTSVSVFGNGLINHTWKIISANKNYLLQKINLQVFKRPEDIMDNLRLLSDYFKQHDSKLASFKWFKRFFMLCIIIVVTFRFNSQITKMLKFVILNQCQLHLEET